MSHRPIARTGSQAVTVHQAAEPDTAFAALTEKQRAFVLAWIATGNKTQSAREAGYSEAGAKQIGHTLSHHPGVKAALDELGHQQLAIEAVRSIATFVKLRDTATKETVRLASAQTLADRGGLHARTAHSVEVTHKTLSPKATAAAIASLAKRTGQDPALLFGNTETTYEEFLALLEGPEPVDAEWEEVPPEPSSEPAPVADDVYGHDTLTEAGVNFYPRAEDAP